jgi:DUF1680 family protein
VNPLEVRPEACIKNSSRSHVKPVRQKWFDCACCPTNIARTFTNLGQYIYFLKENDFFVNLFIQNECSFEVDGKPVSISMTTDFPKTGHIKISVKADDVPFSLNIRIPQYASDFALEVNGSPSSGTIQNNYFVITRIWQNDVVEISFTVKPRLVFANPLVHQNCGKAAIARGPEIYCLEECDNGTNLAALSIDTGSPLEECWREDLLGGIMLVKAKGRRLGTPNLTESFYEKKPPKTEETILTALPYGVWGNRNSGEKGGEMIVWIHESEAWSK